MNESDDALSCGHVYEERCIRCLIWDDTGCDVCGEEGSVFCRLCNKKTEFRIGRRCVQIERKVLFPQ